jgi:hypothetical protein
MRTDRQTDERTDEETDMTKLEVSFRNLANANRTPLEKMACRVMQHSDISNNVYKFLFLNVCDNTINMKKHNKKKKKNISHFLIVLYFQL